MPGSQVGIGIHVRCPAIAAGLGAVPCSAPLASVLPWCSPLLPPPPSSLRKLHSGAAGSQCQTLNSHRPMKQARSGFCFSKTLNTALSPPCCADYPVERLAATADRAFLATASHDATVKIWNLASLAEEGSDDEGEGEGEGEGEEATVGRGSGAEGAAAGPREAGSGPQGAAQAAEAPERQVAAATSYDDDEGPGRAVSSSGDDDDSSDGGKRSTGRQKRKRGAHRIPTKRQHQQKGTNFFSGML